MKNVLLILSVAVLVAGCWNRRPSVAELQQKIDSVKALEVKRQLRLNGVNLEEVSPFRMFYDSLQMQALPLSYSEDYVTSLPGYTVVPTSLVFYLELEGRVAPKAIALPETLGSRLVLLAADVDDGEYELWLYSLDNEYIPVDKLLIYEPSKFLGRRLTPDARDSYFSITSYYDINVWEYADDYDEIGQLSTYIVDDSRLFIEKKPL